MMRKVLILLLSAGMLGGAAAALAHDYTYVGNDNAECIISGHAHRDFLWGQGGNDCIVGYEDRDELHGGTGGDLLQGEGNQDVLYGDADNDWLYGGSGDDTLHGSGGDDFCDGGPGNDSINNCESGPGDGPTEPSEIPAGLEEVADR